MHPERPTEVIFIGGRSGVGKTSVAAEASHLLARAEVRHAVIEGDNLDQAYPQPWREGIDLAGRNLAAIWQNYRAIGYSRLLYTNTVSVLEIRALSAALGGQVRSFGVLLTAADETATRRLAQRERGSALDDHRERSTRTAVRLDTASTAYRVATDGRSLTDIATEILSKAGWLDGTTAPSTADS